MLADAKQFRVIVEKGIGIRTMSHVLLIGKTRKGKTRVTQHGKQWQVMEVFKIGCAERLLLRPIQDLDSDWRWVWSKDDPDFIVESINAPVMTPIGPSPSVKGRPK